MTKLYDFSRRYGAILAFVIALTAMLGSLYYSEVANYIPCKLCWYQRIAMYPLVLVTFVGIVEKDEFLPSYVLPLAIIGMGISGYHYLIQQGLFGNPGTCTIGIPCSARYVNYLGFITIPFMAFTAFTLLTAIMGVTKRAYAMLDSEE